MPRANRDTWVAIVLLMTCGVLLWATFEIREPDYGQLSPATWPRVIVAALSVLSFIFLVQSIRRGPDTERTDVERPRSFVGHLTYWQNVIWCFGLFLAYLLALPYLGMLIGGTLFVFLLLNALGGWSARMLAVHAAIALVAVGGVWSLFTFGLGVILPQGELLGPIF